MSDPGSKISKWRRMAGAGVAAPRTVSPQEPRPTASLADALNDPLRVARNLEQKIGSIRERMDALQLQMKELEKAGAAKEEWAKVDDEFERLSKALDESQEDLEEIGKNIPAAGDPQHTPEMSELAQAIGSSLTAVNDLANRAENLEDELRALAQSAPAQSASLAAGIAQRRQSSAPTASETSSSGANESDKAAKGPLDPIFEQERIAVNPEMEQIIDEAAERIKTGTPAGEAVKPLIDALEKDGVSVPPETRSAIAQASGDIEELKRTIAQASPEERARIREAVSAAATGAPLPQGVPTPALQRVDSLIAAIAGSANAVKLPPKMRGYGKLMYARPTLEVITTAGEAGIISLMATGLLSAIGIPVPAGSALHILTYIGSAVAVGGTNMSTKQDVLLRSAAEGSLKPLVGDPATGNRFSAIRTLTSALRLPILFVSVGAAMGIAQYTIGTVETSQRVAGGMAEPLEKFAQKKKQFDQRLIGFSKVPGKIFEVARKIEEGKPTAGVVKQKGASTTAGYVAWSPAERKQMIDELREVFIQAGIDPALVDTLKFGDPKALGYGPAAKFKEALDTGDTSNVVELGAAEHAALARIVGPLPNTAAYVTQIRAKMGLAPGQRLETRILALVKPFLENDVLAQVDRDLMAARQIEAIIRMQSEDEWSTFVRSFLHGAAPVGPEAAMPYAHAIINSRDKVNELSKQKLQKPITEVFDVLNQALGAVGASVSLVTPQVGLDTSDMERLSAFLQEISQKSVEQNAAEATTEGALEKIYEMFVPGRQKWGAMKRYMAINALRSSGYTVAVRGKETHIFQRTAPLPITAPEQKRQGPTMVEQAWGSARDALTQWREYIFGGRKVEDLPVWNFDQKAVEAATDEQLGEYVLQQLNLLAIKRLNGMMEKKLEISENWQPTMDAAVSSEFFNMTAKEVGSLARRQILMQMRFGGDPRAPIMIFEPAAWTAIQYGVSPPEKATPIEVKDTQVLDPAIWRELSPEATQKLFEGAQNAAAWKGIAYLSLGIGGLVLGVLLVSSVRVRSLNKRLRAAGPEFEKLVKEAEKNLVGMLDSVNGTMAGIPVLRSLPHMDFTMLHAALRLAAEEVYPMELAEDPSGWDRFTHFITEPFQRGPYAHSVAEIMSFVNLIEKLQNSRRMQNRFINIIAPGSARAEKIGKKLSIAEAQGGDLYSKLVSELEQIPEGIEREVFRDSARGNLRFRIAVLDAQNEAYQALQTRFSRRPDPDAELNRKRSAVITEELERLDRERSEFDKILAQLDRESAFERVTEAGSVYAPSRFSARRNEQRRADNIVEIVIPADLSANKTFSAPKGIIEDVQARLDALVAAHA